MWESILHGDQQLLLALNGSWGPGWDTFFFWMSNKLIWIPLYLAMVYGVWRKAGWRGVLLVLICLGITIGLADQTCNFFKSNLPKFRPTQNPDIREWVHTVRGYRGGLYGTVSGHAAISFTIAMFTSLFFRCRWYTIFIFFWAAVVAYSRIYLGVHFPLDITFGTLLGLTLGWASYRVYAWWYKRRRA